MAVPITVGWGEADLVPPEPLALGGYTAREDARFEPGGDTLRVRAIALRQGERKVVIASAELLTIPDSLAREVSARLPTGVSLMLTATHTHCAPDSQMLNDRMTFKVPGIASYSRRWLNWYADRIAEACRVALTEPGEEVSAIHFWVGEVGLNAGRRDGAWINPEALALRLGDSLLVGYAAHATTFDESELRLRSDWPGFAFAIPRTLPLILPSGDLSPRPGLRDAMSAFAAEAGEDFLDAGEAVLRVESEPITLPEVRPHPEFAAAYKVPEALAAIAVKQFASPEEHVLAVQIGEALIVGLPAEPTSELGKRVRERAEGLGFGPVLVVSHANGWLGYVLEADDYARGGYEATLSFNGPELADRLVEAVERAVTRLASGRN